MLILLPPSEAKRPGGRRRALRVATLALPQLAPQREAVIDAVTALAADPGAAARTLKLSARQRDGVADDAALRAASTLPAVDRYAGVVYDALDAGSLDAAARRWLGDHVMIHSALLGPVGALDPIPRYRLSAGVRLPGLPPLKRVWADAVTAALAQARPRLVLDLRSEAYACLGPVPAGVASAYVRVITAAADGRVRALNHFNKHAKGALVRLLAEDRPRIGSVRALREWADAHGVTLRAGAPGELDLVV